jgi:hypothetical protein
VTLWAALKSPMLLSCDVRSLTEEMVALLTNDEMLAIVEDTLGRQAQRLRSSAGATVPQRLYFETCPRGSAPPLARQTWTLSGDGTISSRAYDQMAVSLTNCGQRHVSVAFRSILQLGCCGCAQVTG